MSSMTGLRSFGGVLVMVVVAKSRFQEKTLIDCCYGILVAMRLHHPLFTLDAWTAELNPTKSTF